MLYNKNWLIQHDQPAMWEGFRESMLASPHSPNDNPEEIRERRGQMIDTFKEASKYREDARFILTGTAQETIERIKVGKVDITKFADAMSHKLVTVVIDRNSFYRFIRIRHGCVIEGCTHEDHEETHFNQIWIAKVWTDKAFKEGYNESYFDIFTLDLTKGFVDNYENYAEEAKGHEQSLDQYLDGVTKNELIGMETRAIQILIYLYLSQLEFETVKGLSRIKKGKQKYINQTNRDIILVDSKWNTEIHREEGFEVKGHLRLQPCGVGRMETKLIWVDGFMKHGYHRRAGKQLEHV